MWASFDGLIYDHVKGQIHLIDMEHTCTGAALEANPMITLTVLGPTRSSPPVVACQIVVCLLHYFLIMCLDALTQL